jgi:hypothetical protein
VGGLAALALVAVLADGAVAGSARSTRSPSYLSGADLRILATARYPVLVPPRIPSGWYAPVPVPVPGSAGAWGLTFESGSSSSGGFVGGWVGGGPPGLSACSYLRNRGFGSVPGFRCVAFHARGVPVAAVPVLSGNRTEFFWIKCHTGFNMAADAAQSKLTAIAAVKALVHSLVPAGVGPSTAGC